MGKIKSSATWRVSTTLLFSLIAMIINYMISFALTPYITTHIGTEAYGFVSLAKTISNYGIVITGCLNTYASRFITIAYHEGDKKKANQYFSSVVFANLLLLSIVIVFEFFFIGKLQWFINIPYEMIGEVKVLFALDITNYMCLALANTFVASAYIKNRLDRLEVIKALSYITEAAVLIVLFRLLSPKVYYVGIGLLMSTMILGVCNYIQYRKLTPDLSIKQKYFSWRAVKDLVFSGIWNSINSVGNLLNSGLDLWVTNLMLSATSMGQLSIVKTVSTIIGTLQSLISRPFQPYLLKYYSANDNKRVVKLLNLEIKIAGYVSNMICAGLICFGKVYYRLWTPNQDIDLLYAITIVTIIGFLIDGMIQPLFYTYTLTLKNKIPCYVTIGSGLLNVLGMYLLLKYTNLNLYAVVGTTTVLGFFTYLIFTPIYTARCLKQKWTVFYVSILRVLISEIFIILIIFTLFRAHMPKSWIGLIAVALLCCIIGLPIHMVCVLNKEELLLIMHRFKGKNK